MIAADLPIAVVIVTVPAVQLRLPSVHTSLLTVWNEPDFGATFDRDAYTATIVDILHKHEIDLAAMAGFGTVLGSAAFQAFPGRILNTHLKFCRRSPDGMPSLQPLLRE